MKSATLFLILSASALTTANAYCQAAAENAGAAATATKTTAGAAGALGEAVKNATSGAGAATSGAGAATPKPASSGPVITTVHMSPANSARRVPAQLVQKIDSKTAKIGDGIVARTTTSAVLARGVTLPAGTRLMGKVTEVRTASADQPNGRLAFNFDRAVLASGRQLPIHATLAAISGPGSPAVTAQQSGAGTVPPPAVIAAPIRVMSAEGTTVYGETGVVTQSSGAASAAASSLPGVTASNSASTGSILNATGRDVELARGTQMVLSVTKD